MLLDQKRIYGLTFPLKSSLRIEFLPPLMSLINWDKALPLLWIRSPTTAGQKLGRSRPLQWLTEPQGFCVNVKVLLTHIYVYFFVNNIDPFY